MATKTDKLGNDIPVSDTASDDGGTASDVDMSDGLPPERVARNLALHLAAADGDVEQCRVLLDGSSDEGEEGADAWWEDGNSLNWSALHFAADAGHTEVVRLLLRRGALWNAVDETGTTAAEVAWSYNDEETYRVIFDEGVRQTLVLNLLNRKGYANSTSRMPAAVGEIDKGSNTVLLAPTESTGEVSATNGAFLESKLSFVRDEQGKMRCVDRDGGLVMAAWETDVMERTATLLCEDADVSTGLRILNIGFGLGIVDECFQRYKPARHVIVEAHPDAVAFAKQSGWHDRSGVEIVHKRWEEALDELSGSEFDVIYWDTYAQGYGELRDFFEEVPYLLAGPNARFSFFHGLAGTNRFLYDVYTRVSELDMRELGMDTAWDDVRPKTTAETWNGIVRKYWDLDVLRIPVCRLVEQGVLQ